MSAAVFGVLVVLWAAVLVPMWLRRHDRNSELAAADRFAGAMRVLSRRGKGSAQRGAERAAGRNGNGAAAEGRYVLMPPRPPGARRPHVSAPERVDDSGVASTGRLRPAIPSAARPRRFGSLLSVFGRVLAPVRRVASRTPHSSRNRRVAARRRLAMLMALAFCLTLLLAAALGGFFVAVQAFTDVLVLGGLAHLRGEVIADRARSRRAARHRVARAGVSAHRPVRYVEQVEGGEEAVAVAATVAAPPAYGAAAYGSPQPARYRREALAERPSEPERRPAPPVAPATVRYAAAPAAVAYGPTTVDLTQPGKWSDQQAATAQWSSVLPAGPERSLLGSALFDGDPVERALLEEADGLDAILRRAVGE